MSGIDVTQSMVPGFAVIVTDGTTIVPLVTVIVVTADVVEQPLAFAITTVMLPPAVAL